MDHQEYLAKRQATTLEGRREVFEQAKKLENEDREFFSRARDGWEVIERQDLCIHPHKSLIPIYGPDGNADEKSMSIDPLLKQDANRDTRAFVLNKSEREKLVGQLAVVPTLAEFKTTFLDVFCEGQLRYLNWNNVFAAGGGVLACTQPVPKEHDDSLTSKRNYFHQVQYGSSDVDLFLYGLNEQDAKRKLEEIYQAVSESCPHTVVCFRSAHAVTLVSQYPFRHIQIVLRLYSSPYEILAGFDVDACTIGFDGKNVYSDVRAHHALITRKNTIDVSRRSPSYEMRLAKYGVRGFEVEVNDLQRENVDPGIYERPWNSLDGLAKLLVLERLRTPEQRSRFFEMQKASRAGGDIAHYHSNRSPMYDSATQERIEEKLGGTAEISNYSTVFLAWGPDETAEKTMRLMAAKDFKLNNKWFARDRTYRLHPCFFGTMSEVLQDCSPDDPPFPAKKENEDAKMREHRETYVRGPLTFISDDPGRQRIGSFHPLSEVGWAEGVYFHETTEELFSATNADDPARVKLALANCIKGADVRDFFGRTALHLAIMAGSHNVIPVLLQAGASPLEPMAGGRTPFHLCAIYGCTKEQVVALRDAAEALLLKKWQSEEAAVAATSAASNDDFVVVNNAMEVEGAPAAVSNETKKKAKTVVSNAIRAADGDATMSALQLAILLGHLHTARALLECGAVFYQEDALAPNPIKPVNPVQLLSDDLLEEGIKLFVEFGFKASNVGRAGNNTVHDLCISGDHVALKSMLKLDPTIMDCVNDLYNGSQTPLQLAITYQHVECAEVLLQTGKCEMTVTEEMVQAARLKRPNQYYCANPVPVYIAALVNVFNSLQQLMNTSDLTNSKRTFDSALKLITLLAPYMDFKAKYDRLQNSMHVSGMGFDPQYWIQKKIMDPNAYGVPFLITLNDMVAYYIGKFWNTLEATTVAINAKAAEVSQATFFSVCQEIESKLDGHFAQQAVRRYRLESQTAYVNQADLHEGVDAVIKQYLDKVSAKTQEVQRLAKVEAKKHLDTLTKLLKPTKAIVDYYHTYVVNNNNNNNNNIYGGRHPFARGHHQPTSVTDPYVKASNMFFQKTEEEAEIRNFLLLSEKRFPVPENVPVDLAKNCTEPWAIAAMQRKVFELCARSFASVDRSGFSSYNPNPNEFGTMAWQGYNRTNHSPALQECVALMFNHCRKQGFAEFDKLHELADKAPIASVDQEGNTVLVMAILAKNPALLVELVALFKKQLYKPKAAKRTGPASDRIDNFALMEEMEDIDSDEDIDARNAMGDDNHDDDEDEDEGAEDDDEDGGGTAAAPAAVQPMNPNQTTTKPEQMFCIVSKVYLEDLELTKKINEWREADKKRVGQSLLTTFKGMLSLAVTPVQLAIVLGDMQLLAALVNEAKKLSPYLLRSILGHCLAAQPSGYRQYGHHRGARPIDNGTLTISNSFELAIALDRVDILQYLISEGGIGLDFNAGVEVLYNLNPQGSSVPWQFYLEKSEADLVSDAAAAEVNSKKKKRATMGHYTGLVSSLYGATKKKNEMKRDPRLARISMLPNPTQTLLIFAAKAGSVESYKALREANGSVFSAVRHFLSEDNAKSVRKLIAKARERTPALFAKSGFGALNEDITAEHDARVIMRSLIGGDELATDTRNATPLHHMVANQTLDVFKHVVSSELLGKDYTKVSLRDSAMFAVSTQTTLGKFTIGGSPLSYACEHGLLDEVSTLLELGFNPNLPDAYSYGMNAFHLSLHSNQWSSAKLVATKMDANRLLERNEFGITPLMTAARAGNVAGLLAAVAACPKANASLVARSVNQVNSDGFSALHFAASARFSSTLKRLIEWSVGEEANQLAKEEYTSSRTPLELSLTSFLQAQPGNSSTHRQKRARVVGETKKDEEDEVLVDPRISPKEVARAKEERTYWDASAEGLNNNDEAYEILLEKTKGMKRIRALFPDVRPARERRFEAVGSVEVGTDLELLRDDFSIVWGNSSMCEPIPPATFDKNQTDVKERIQRRIAAGLYATANFNVKAVVF